MCTAIALAALRKALAKVEALQQGAVGGSAGPGYQLTLQWLRDAAAKADAVASGAHADDPNARRPATLLEAGTFALLADACSACAGLPALLYMNEFQDEPLLTEEDLEQVAVRAEPPTGRRGARAQGQPRLQVCWGGAQ